MMENLGVALYNSIFKDYSIISSDDREVLVHKCILYACSDYFKNALDDRFLQENSTKTEFDYDDILVVVKWMYGFEVQLTTISYYIADMFAITDLLSTNFTKYITIDDDYMLRFSSIVAGDTSPTLLENRYYAEIYDAVVYHISTTKYTVGEYSKLINIHIDILESWFTSKYRLMSEYGIAHFMCEYYITHKHKRAEIKEKLFVHINFDIMSEDEREQARKIYTFFNGSEDGFEQKPIMDVITSCNVTYAYLSRNVYYEAPYKFKRYTMYLLRDTTDYTSVKESKVHIDYTKCSLDDNKYKLEQILRTEEEYKRYIEYINTSEFRKWHLGV